MAGDSRVFQEALKRGSAHGWRGEWDRAVDEYRLAYQQFPEDMSARTYLAMALFRSGQAAESLELYRRLWRSQPANLTFLQRVAELEDGLGQSESAGASYGLLAELYGRRRANKEALRNWRRVVELRPNDGAAWDSLLEVASQVGVAVDLIPSYLEHARQLALGGSLEDALRVADRARALDPSNPVVVPLINAVKRAFEFCFRTAAEGEEPLPEDIARFIPSLDELAMPLPAVQRGDGQPPREVEEPDELPEPELPEPEMAEPVAESPTAMEPEDDTAGEAEEIAEEETPAEEVEPRVEGDGGAPEVVAEGEDRPGEVAAEAEGLSGEVAAEGEPEVEAPLDEIDEAPELSSRLRDRWFRVLEDDSEPDSAEVVSAAIEPDRLIAASDAEVESELAASTEAEADSGSVSVASIEPDQPSVDEREAGEAPVQLPGDERFDAPAQLEADRALWERDPSDLSLLQRVAEQEVAVGELESAAESYHILAQVYTKRAIYGQALGFWLKAAQLQPGNRQFWASTLDVSARAGSLAEVLPRYLDFVRELALQGRFQEAIEAADEARTLDPDNQAILTLLLGIRRALERSWREAASGDALSHDELAEIIPPVEPVPALPAFDTGQEAIERVEEGEAAAERPAPDGGIAGYAPAEPEAVDEDVQTSGGLLSRLDRWFWKGSRDTKKVSIPEAANSTELEVADVAPEPVAPELEVADAAAEVALPEPSLSEPSLETSIIEEQPAMEERSVPRGFREEPPREILVTRSAGTAGETRDTVDVPGPVDLGAQAEPERPDGNVDAPLEDAGQPSEDEAGGSKTLREAEALFRQSLAAGAAMAEQVAALAELEERQGNTDAALDAYARALGIAPDLPAALLGLARLRISSGDLELAEADLRRAIESDVPQRLRMDASAVDLLLRLFREKAVQGDPDAGASGLASLLVASVAHGFPPFLMDKLTPVAIELLGRCVGEHLGEIALLPSEAQEDVILGLWRAEEQLAMGHPRSAVDDAYRILAAHPGFLPAQSMLARVFAASGKLPEARERWGRLLPLYELRGTSGRALELLWWMVAYGVADDADRRRLLSLLRSRDRLGEATLVESEDRQGMLSRWGLVLIPRTVKPGLEPEEALLKAEAVIGASAVVPQVADHWDVEPGLLVEKPKPEENPAAVVLEERFERIPQAWEDILAMAESKFRAGDRQGASGLIEAALQMSEGADDIARAALLRVIQTIDPTPTRRAELMETLGRLSLPGEFVQ